LPAQGQAAASGCLPQSQDAESARRLLAPDLSVLDIVGLYSNTGENFGAIADPSIGNQQKTWLTSTLKDIANERKAGTKQALFIAVHHPPFASGLQETGFGHPGNPIMLQDIDDCCTQAALWPDAVLSAHAHNYQRYMRTMPVGGSPRTIPYLIAGGGGITPQRIPPLGAQQTVSNSTVRCVTGLKGYGYLSVTVSASKLTFVYTEVTGLHGDVFETVNMDLKTGQQV
jgi:hypothetical protein